MAPLALAAIWFGSPYFPVLVALVAAGMAWEWARLAAAERWAAMAFVIATPLAAIATIAFGAPLAAVGVAMSGAILVAGAAVATGVPAPLWLAAGTAWISLPCLAILWMAGETNGRATIFWLFAIVWGSDIGAYVAGRSFGGPRLAPRLSPNKTWSGALGGAACAGLVGGIAALLLGGPATIWIAMSLLLSIAAQLGDLVESSAKRKFGVKDSGTLIPGHGGLLDRLDSLLTAAALLGLLALAGATAPLGLLR